MNCNNSFNDDKFDNVFLEKIINDITSIGNKETASSYVSINKQTLTERPR